MKRLPRPQKEKKLRRRNVTPDISTEDMEMLEDAREEKVISDDELINMLQ